MDISKSVRVGLAKQKKRQNWLARELGVSDNYISCLCKGTKTPSLRMCSHIASVFNVPLSTLIKWGESDV